MQVYKLRRIDGNFKLVKNQRETDRERERQREREREKERERKKKRETEEKNIWGRIDTNKNPI